MLLRLAAVEVELTWNKANHGSTEENGQQRLDWKHLKQFKHDRFEYDFAYSCQRTVHLDCLSAQFARLFNNRSQKLKTSIISIVINKFTFLRTTNMKMMVGPTGIVNDIIAKIVRNVKMVVWPSILGFFWFVVLFFTKPSIAYPSSW